MSNCRKSITTKKEAIKKRSICIIIVIAVMATICGCGSKASKQPEEYFVEYENATTLVRVEYGERTFLGYSAKLGFINDDIYEKYKNNEYQEGKIQIYHPYIKGKSTVVDVNAIASITEQTYESFYEDYPPSIYAR